MFSQEHGGGLTRRRFLKSAAMAAGAMVAGNVAGSAAWAAPEPQPVRGGMLRYGLAAEPRRMNQLNTTWMTDATQHLYDRLLTRVPDGGYMPHLASWSISSDKLTWTFRLKPGIRCVMMGCGPRWWVRWTAPGGAVRGGRLARGWDVILLEAGGPLNEPRSSPSSARA